MASKLWYELFAVIGDFVKNKQSSKKKTVKFTMVTSIVLMFAVMLSFLSFSTYAKDRYMNLQLFTRVLNLAQKYYVEKVDYKNLIYGGLKGMLSVLDPHTNFLPPDVFKEFENETSGEFGGIGIEITVKNSVLTIISPIEDTPAWKAGIKAGDKVVSINGESTKGFTLVEAAQRMKGKNGTVIGLGIIREGLEEPKIINVKRGVIKIKSVKYTNLADGYGYFKVTSFIENTVRDLKKYIKKHEKKHGLKGVIIDLRKNPGGLLDQAVKMSDLFLDKGDIVSIIGRDKSKKEVKRATKMNTYLNTPVIVLIDEYSASASEIVAAALKENKRAVVMGQKSFGKGSVQSVIKLGDGSGLKLTVARYYTPKGKSIQSVGVEPDVYIEDVKAEAFKKAIIKKRVRKEKDIKGHLVGEDEKKSKVPWWKKANKIVMSRGEKLIDSDYQVSQAYNYLKAWKVINKMNQ